MFSFIIQKKERQKLVLKKHKVPQYQTDTEAAVIASGSQLYKLNSHLLVV